MSPGACRDFGANGGRRREREPIEGPIGDQSESAVNVLMGTAAGAISAMAPWRTGRRGSGGDSTHHTQHEGAFAAFVKKPQLDRGGRGNRLR